MFGAHGSDAYRAPLPGVRFTTMVYGRRTLLTEFRLTHGSVLPRHAHPHEQTGYLVAGRLRLTVGEETRELGAGDAWCIPGGTEHLAEALDDVVAVEVFSPVREDYLPGR